MLHIKERSGDWIETPAGWLGRRELREFADRLMRIPLASAERLVIDWSGVRHCDFRALPLLGAALLRLRESGLTVIGFGMSNYLLAIALVGLSTDEAEIFADFAEETGRSFARAGFESAESDPIRTPSWKFLEN